MRRIGRVGGVVVLMTAGLGMTGGVAQAAPAQSATADVTSGAFHLKFSAQRAADAPATAATGTFEAETTAGGVSLMKVAGPVTCLDVRGNTLGLFYPVTSSTPSLLADAKTGVFIYLESDGAGRAKMVGFVPVPFNTTRSCAPSAAPLPAMGSATLVGAVPTPAPAPRPAPAAKRLSAKTTARFTARRASTRVTRLRVSGLPAGASVSVTCATRARGCPFASRTPRPSSGAVSVEKLFGKARLRPGAVVRIALAAPGFRTRTVTYTVRRARQPARKTVG